MNTGAGLILIPISLLCLFIAFFVNKKRKSLGKLLFVLGVLIVMLSFLLLSGLYDPYSDHIR